MRTLCLTLSLTFITGCASMASSDEEPRHVGTIDKSFKISRTGKGLSALYGSPFGELINSALTSPVETNRYYVRTADGNVSAASDEAYAVGDCVIIVPRTGASPGSAYAYGDARLQRSDRCPKDSPRSTPAAAQTSQR